MLAGADQAVVGRSAQVQDVDSLVEVVAGAGGLLEESLGRRKLGLEAEA